MKRMIVNHAGDSIFISNLHEYWGFLSAKALHGIYNGIPFDNNIADIKSDKELPLEANNDNKASRDFNYQFAYTPNDWFDCDGVHFTDYDEAEKHCLEKYGVPFSIMVFLFPNEFILHEVWVF